MYKEYGKNKDMWKLIADSLSCLLLLIFLIFLLVIFAGEGRYEIALITLLSTSLVTAIAYDQIKLTYARYPLVVTDFHVVVNRSFGRRGVYDQNKISRLYIIKNVFFMIHDGLPVVVAVKGIAPEQIKEFREIVSRRGLVKKISQPKIINH